MTPGRTLVSSPRISARGFKAGITAWPPGRRPRRQGPPRPGHPGSWVALPAPPPSLGSPSPLVPETSPRPPRPPAPRLFSTALAPCPTAAPVVSARRGQGRLVHTPLSAQPLEAHPLSACWRQGQQTPMWGVSWAGRGPWRHDLSVPGTSLGRREGFEMRSFRITQVDPERG